MSASTSPYVSLADNLSLRHKHMAESIHSGGNPKCISLQVIGGSAVIPQQNAGDLNLCSMLVFP